MTADFAFYAGEYRGTLPQDEFERLGVRAGAYIEEITFGRAGRTEDPALLRRVMLAQCAAVDACALEEQGGPVASETAGKYSVARVADARSPARRLREAVRPYLSGTGLLYPGV